jgi:hypothetical protein
MKVFYLVIEQKPREENKPKMSFHGNRDHRLLPSRMMFLSSQIGQLHVGFLFFHLAPQV